MGQSKFLHSASQKKGWINLLNHHIDDKTVQNFFDYYYHDRGMLKWQGFMLSDHVSALRKEHKEAFDDSFMYMDYQSVHEELEHKGQQHVKAVATYLNDDGNKAILSGIVMNLQPNQVTIMTDDDEIILSISQILLVQ